MSVPPVTSPPKDDLDDTLAEIRRRGLEHIYRRLPPGNAGGLPAPVTARPTGRPGAKP